MIRINRKNEKAFYDALASKAPLYMPIRKAGEVNYGKYESGVETAIDTLKTVKSPKDFFFPQSENMMKFKAQGQKIDIIDVRSEKDPFVVFGVRACDFKAFSVLDNVFLQEPVDTFYKARREAGIIVTHACGNPEESCFCTVFGIDAADPQGDATVWTDENYMWIRSNTEKGNVVTEAAKAFAEKEDDETVEKMKTTIREKIEALPYAHLDISAFKPERLNELFNMPIWQELSEACLGCGACTFVCPTCQCFDIRDFKTNDGVIRFRCWDSCMYSDFTQMAAANPRTTQMQRYRQRFMHKLVYYPSQYNGTYSCVGCGRCVKKCPQHLNIIKVIKKTGEAND